MTRICEKTIELVFRCINELNYCVDRRSYAVDKGIYAQIHRLIARIYRREMRLLDGDMELHDEENDNYGSTQASWAWSALNIALEALCQANLEVPGYVRIDKVEDIKKARRQVMIIEDGLSLMQSNIMRERWG